MGEQSVNHMLAVFVELVHLLCRIAFGHNCKVNTTGHVASPPYIIIRYVRIAKRANQDVVRIQGMRQLSRYAVVEISQRNGNDHRPLGHRHIEAG